MGKNSVIKSLARVIGNVVMHKILLEKTNKPESKSHLKYEIIEYGANAFEKAKEFNWNENDKIEIGKRAIERVKNLNKNYLDIFFSEIEAERLIDETMEELEL